MDDGGLDWRSVDSIEIISVEIVLPKEVGSRSVQSNSRVTEQEGGQEELRLHEFGEENRKQHNIREKEAQDQETKQKDQL